MQQLTADEVTDALLAASTGLVAVAARSLAAVADDVTLLQFRALVVLSHGPLAMSGLANELAASPSATTRLCDRLVRKELVSRSNRAESRREVEVAITADGRRLVKGVLARRRREIARVVSFIPADKRGAMVEALNAFARAASTGSAESTRSRQLGWDL